MNTYNAYYKGRTTEVKADTSYAAQQAAVEEFKRITRKKISKPWEVTVVLAAQDDATP